MDKPSARITGSAPYVPKCSNLEVFLKSGHTVKIRCEEWNFKFNTLTGEYTGYRLKGLIEPNAVGFVPSQIAGYTVR
jgi:hypothetical protein